jgi:hypothetical protein
MIPELTDTIRGEISVEGSPADPEMIDDIAHKRVVHRILEHRLREADFLLVQYGWPPTAASSLSGRRETCLGVFDD